MRILAALAMLSLPVASDAAGPAGNPALGCPSHVQQAREPGSAANRKLGELPPGSLYLTVMRNKGSGCYEPVRVRDNFGGPAFRDPAPSRRR